MGKKDNSINFYVGDANNPVQVPYIVDQWVPIDVIVDLENDHSTVFYGGQFVAEYQWTAGAFGGNNGQPQIAAVDLWANGSSPIFYDDMIIEEIPHRPTLKLVDPLTGSILGGGLDELRLSDDQYLTTRSGFGNSLVDLHNTELRVVFDFRNAEMIPPVPFGFTVESALEDDPTGQLHLYGFDLLGREFVPLGAGPMGMQDALLQVPLDPQRFVAPNGMVDLRVKNTVFVPFLAFGYESRFDLMVIAPQQP